ncbi:16S rRNA (guanine(966)-N(2))-methyltransferase RsmD [Ruegeria pomeroyi]|uniref:Methyltransferase, putative n=2 Tax=Ruegeria pomeroyi TaxID=89184 RepID=Q5LM26_RUEPO|nr:16S rRNA (guanine(966)-N(2))-methyltransferase RsmD [Ruegeria pomeroyi]AAV96959.1 methyltransferase, putative [Ruegeria pomeroyi DSS-3]NVK98005.1 16S rRNA (guanine(966)-N(2))-methyltransferase RsmD [Ruegeria pomeroyi]NVL02444.1 16S rRNA (guanine(966)-N(2))-methyltransferase RsmD [Ruegeria pomeroyi]QWV10488.1 16S rRNA (guanine(966)-N(2))-methyltransferase RsmD [Ruegeria pomeroyi]
MRIIAGAFRGRALASVGKGDAGAHLRPTTDRVRESLFSVLTHLDVIEGAQVLDLFAGTGALGLEALSRGAEHVTFVDDGRVAQGLITKNINLTGSLDWTTLIRRDATRLGPNPGAPCGLIFLDPPYGKGMGARALATALAGGWVADDALIVWEESAPMPAPEGFTLHDARKYGDTHITLMWRAAPS